MTNFLVSSAGRRGALVQIFQQVAQATGGGSVVAIDASSLSAAGNLADAFEIVPRIDDADFVDAVLKVSDRYGIDVIVPTIDPEIAVYAQNRAAFAERDIDVWAPSTATAELGFDKWKLFSWLNENDIPTVDTFEVTDASWRSLDGPVIAKPRCGSSSIGVIDQPSAGDLPINLGTDYIVQRKAIGVELTVDFAVDEMGAFLGAVPRQRLEVRSGEVSKGTTVHLPEVERVVEDLVNRLPGMYGVGNAQVFFDDETEDIRVIEINPRFGGGYPLAHEAGADFITAMLAPKQGPHRRPIFDWKTGVTMLRYDAAVFLRPNGGA